MIGVCAAPMSAAFAVDANRNDRLPHAPSPWQVAQDAGRVKADRSIARHRDQVQEDAAEAEASKPCHACRVARPGVAAIARLLPLKPSLDLVWWMARLTARHRPPDDTPSSNRPGESSLVR
jgi:hypothetical protein